ncbi:MAG: efflux RND transporter permease subunit [Thermacetogeniaceae bacterium]|jgi:HAE1 family hydrophobic/amphiphilic exporter-1
MKIADVSVDRPVLITMIMVALILIGAIALPMLPVDLYPNLSIPIAVVSIPWSGYTPSVVEQQVTVPVEKAMAGVDGVQEVDSMSRQGNSVVMLHFSYTQNMDTAVANIRDKVNQVMGQLPSSVGAPEILKMDPNSTPIMTIALSGNNVNVEQLLELANDVVVPRAQGAAGVASIGVNGGNTREIQVIVDPDKMRDYGLSITSIVSALQSDNMQGDAGLINKGDQQIDLHVNGQFQTPGDVLQVPIRLPSGQSIQISDVAQVTDAYADTTEYAYYNGIPCVTLSIMKVTGGNTVQIAGEIAKLLPTINRSLPAGVKLTVVSNQATFIQQSINTVIDHTMLGAIFSLIVLWLFLRRVRTTAVIAVVLPISVISTFAAMYFAGQTINTITLGGLALGLGSLVDFAVVVIESIARHSEAGVESFQAAKVGAHEVGTAVLASALCQICVFAPIVFTQGLASQEFLPMALAVVFSHIAALVGALTMVPMLAARFMRGKAGQVKDGQSVGRYELPKPAESDAGDGGWFSRWNPSTIWSGWIEKLKTRYERLLRWALGHRKVVLLATVALLLVSLLMIPVIGFELAPQMDEDAYSVRIALDQDTNVNVTNQVMQRVEGLIRQMPETASIYDTSGSNGGNSIMGSGATNSASINVNLKPISQRKRSVFQIIDALRQETAMIPGAQITAQATQVQTMGRGGTAVQVVIQGSDPTVLASLGDLMASEMQQVPGTRDLQNTADKNLPEYVVNINRAAEAQYGITTQQVLNTITDDYGGESAGTNYIAGSSSTAVEVMLPENYTRDYTNLSAVTVVSPSGQQVPITDLATITASAGPATIRRTDQVDEITVQCDVFGRSAGQVQNDLAARLNQITFPTGYFWSFGGQALDMAQSFSSLGMVMPLSIILMYMVMAGLFESLATPFIIMFCLPFTFVGAALGLLLMRQTLSINSIMGCIMLIGIVMNNSIVLVDYTNQLRQQGQSAKEALYRAGPIRLRPILMTALVTVLAMFPLMVGHGEGAESEASMATVVVFGLILSTLVTLVLVPVMYSIFDDLSHRKARSSQGVRPSLTVQPE